MRCCNFCRLKLQRWCNVLGDQEDIRTQDHQWCLAPMCGDQALWKVAALYSIFVQVQAYFFPRLTYGSSSIILIGRVAPAAWEGDV